MMGQTCEKTPTGPEWDTDMGGHGWRKDPARDPV